MLHFPSVAVVILNWNGKAHLQTFLPSVVASTYPNLKIIIADNASGDDSISFIQNNYKEIDIIPFDKNYGFAQGYNEALKLVESDYYILLNSDVAVTPDWIEPMIQLLEQKVEYVACQPKVLAYKNKKQFEYAGAAGGWLDAFGYPFARGRIFDVCEEDTGQYNDTAEIFWATGASLVIKRFAFHEVGGFDNYFFAHQEEIDLCWRLHLKGYRIFCCPQSVVYHVGGGTLPRGNSKKTFLNFRNNQIMLAKNLPWNEKWWKIPFRIFLDQVSAFKGLLGGEGGYFVSILDAHLAFIYWILFHSKNGSRHQKKLKTLQGVYPKNIVWQHFAKKKKKFSEIVQNKG
ncbi:MAG: glycosyltransferase family 2 protein [Chitinophagaceae bacterium]